MYKSEVIGRGGISAKVVESSISQVGKKLTTLELKYPRFIHSEFMTHRVFSRNASSSRAIPIDKMIEQVEKDPASPIHWGKNKAGMQADLEVDHIYSAQAAWRRSAKSAVKEALYLKSLGLHKQIVNRVLEPFQFITVVVTATEWDNFFKLRCHADAQPEIKELADCMRSAMAAAKYVYVDLHLPYISKKEKEELPVNIAFKVSAARCARVSYLNHDKSDPIPNDDIHLADRLLSSGHMSPFEHQAIDFGDYSESGNFIGWEQYRQTL